VLVALSLVALSTAWTVMGTFAVACATRKRAPELPRDRLPPVTVLKPLCGADPSLRENLESFFRQDHASFEIIFGVEWTDDPAVAIVRELIAEHPDVDAKLVVHSGKNAHNPKVRNLLGMIDHAANDLVLVSDSNVRAPSHYLAEMCAVRAADDRVALVTNLFAGDGRGSVGTSLECVQLSGFIAAGAALPTLVGDAIVVGKSMLFSRTELARLGGLERVADVLAEDYVIAKMFEDAGRRIAIAPTVLTNVVGKLPVRGVFDRHLRWSMLRVRLRPAFFALEPLTIPLAVLPAAYLVMGLWALAWLGAMLAIRDAGGWLLLRGRSRLHVPLTTSLLRDVLMIAVWMATPFKRHVSWRGTRVRVCSGTLLVTEP
jgi:ceramide glucosyltransferase